MSYSPYTRGGTPIKPAPKPAESEGFLKRIVNKASSKLEGLSRTSRELKEQEEREALREGYLELSENERFMAFLKRESTMDPKELGHPPFNMKVLEQEPTDAMIKEVMSRAEAFDTYEQNAAKAKEVFEKKFSRDLAHLGITLPAEAARKLEKHMEKLALTNLEDSKALLAELTVFDENETAVHKNMQVLKGLGNTMEELNELQSKLDTVQAAENRSSVWGRIFYGKKALAARKQLVDDGIKISNLADLIKSNRQKIEQGQTATVEVAAIMGDFQEARKRILKDIAEASGVTKIMQSKVNEKILDMMSPDADEVRDAKGDIVSGAASSAGPDHTWLKAFEMQANLDDEVFNTDNELEFNGMDYIGMSFNEATVKKSEESAKARIVEAVKNAPAVSTWKELDAAFEDLFKMTSDRDLIKEAFARAVSDPTLDSKRKMLVNSWRLRRNLI